MEVLGIQDEKSIEYERVHRMDKPRNGTRTIITDRERVFKRGRKLKDTNYKMYEDIPKELHELRKKQMDKLKNASQ